MTEYQPDELDTGEWEHLADGPDDEEGPLEVEDAPDLSSYTPEDFEVADDELLEPDEDEWDEDATPYDGDEPEQDQTEVRNAAVGMLSMVRDGSSAIAWALSKTSWMPPGMCQQFTRSAFNVPAYYGSAASAWANASKRHPTSDRENIPRAVPVFFTGGSRGFGHATVSLGNGLVRSTDWPYRGRVGTARITDIERSWGQHFVGWTEDINRFTVWEPAKPPLPIVDASFIAHCVRAEEKPPNGRLLKMAVAREVGRGNMSNSALLGKAFRHQYALVQRKYLQTHNMRVTGNLADGIPGPASLKWLGQRHGFRITG